MSITIVNYFILLVCLLSVCSLPTTHFNLEHFTFQVHRHDLEEVYTFWNISADLFHLYIRRQLCTNIMSLLFERPETKVFRKNISIYKTLGPSGFYFSVCVFVCLSVCISVCLSDCLSVSALYATVGISHHQSILSIYVHLDATKRTLASNKNNNVLMYM